MMTPDDTAREAIARLQRAVEQIGDALANPCVDALLASELAVEEALAGMPSLDVVSAASLAALRTELDGARVALLRCRRLGTGLTDFIRLSLEPQGIGAGYGRPPLVSTGQALNQRI